MTARAWAWFTGGIASGLGLAGVYHWRYRRPPPLGRIFKVGQHYFADTAVVDELVRRIPGSERRGMDRAQIYLHRRGRVTFESDLDTARTLPGQVGPHLFRIHAPDTSAEDLVIELVSFGLARAGGAFSTWPIQGPRGAWTPAAEPLHPTAFDPKEQARDAVAPLPKHPPPPPGHYFKVGEHVYVDEHALLTLESFRHADHEGRTVVPLWRRGHLEVFPMTRARMLPEQVGALHRVVPHLTGVSLDDLMIELEGFGLVSWGGTWPAFPQRLAGYVATGPWTREHEGRVFEHEGRAYLDQAARARVLSRAPIEAGSVLWRGHAFQLVWVPRTPRGESRGLYLVTPVGRAPEDALTWAFVDDLVLHRIARRDASATALPEPGGARPLAEERAEADRLRVEFYERRFEDVLGRATPPKFTEVVLRHLREFDARRDPDGDALARSLRQALQDLAPPPGDPAALDLAVELATDLIKLDGRELWRRREAPDAAALRAAVARVATLPRPELAPLRRMTRRHAVPSGALAVVALDPAEALGMEPEDRYSLALHLPDGRGLLFSLGQLADPSAEDLHDPERRWDWSADPDGPAVLLAGDLAWPDVADILNLNLEDLHPTAPSSRGIPAP